MTTVIIKRRSVTVEGVLRFLDKGAEILFPLDKKTVYLQAKYGVPYVNIEDYFPSVILRTANSLQRQGLVKKIQTKKGIVVKITAAGKQQILKFNLLEFKPKKGRWDGKWHMVFFDVPTDQNSKRDSLRYYLKRLGLQMMQDSVWVSPYDVSDEIKYIREMLDIPHMVKLATMDYLENSDELKQLFNL